jgi:cytochrome c-type biogenesis protein CcmH
MKKRSAMKNVRVLRAWLAASVLLALHAHAIDITVLPTDELQQRYEALTHEFKCMQCQNNSIADSPVGLASDLRRDVQEQLLAGKSDEEIRASMVKRYGNVILFSPPMEPGTIWVWIAPIAVLAGGVLVAVVIVRRRRALVASDDSVVQTDDVPR